LLILITFSGFVSAQTDTSKTLQGGGVDQHILDSLGLVNPELQKKYNEGVRALTSQNFMEASQRFTEVILMNPSYAAAYYNRGMAYKGLAMNDKAVADFNRAIELDPANAEAAYMKVKII
jgi:tetratricopeptide (TPR) repeat protein